MGQGRIIREMKAVTRRNRWSILIRGGYGYGKTLLATLLAATLAALSSYQIPSKGRVTISPRYGIHIIDECHQIRNFEALYGQMELYNFIFCTNKTSALPEPFISRCFSFQLSDYTVSELARIVAWHAWNESTPVSNSVARFIGSRCRGNPRTGVRLMQKFAALYSRRDLDTAQVAFKEFGIDSRGLNRLDRKALEILSTGPKSRRTLATRLGVSLGEYDRIEPFLLAQGLVDITSKGRVLC